MIDSETAGWGFTKGWDPERVPGCWIPGGLLDAEPALAMPRVFEWFRTVARLMPGNVGDKLAQKIDALTVQKPAYIFRVPDGGCTPG